MQLKSIVLLLLAATLVLGQDSTRAERQRQLAASRRNKLIEDAQAQRAAPIAAPRRRLVNRRPAARVTEAPVTTTAAPTTTTTEAPIVTEPAFTDFTVFTEVPEVQDAPVEVQQQQQQQQVQEEEEIIPSFRPRPVLRPVLRPLEEEVFEQIEEQPAPVQAPVQRVQRPLAGPTRTRVQPNVQQTFRQEAPVRAPALSKPLQSRPRDEVEEERKPFVETVRRYSFTGDDGSFTFGYENADGSFKEETRGVDCVVRGKYGYIDTDGVRREFTYQTGNPCDPNAVQPETGLEEEEPVRPVATRRPVARPVVSTARPAVAPRPEVQQVAERRPSNLPTFQQSQAISQQNRNRDQQVQQQEQQQQSVDEEREIAQVLETPTRIVRPQQAAPVRPPPARVQQPQPVQQEQPALPVGPRPQLTPFNLEEEVARFSGDSRPQVQSFPRPAPRPIFDDNEQVFVERRPPVAQPRPEQRPVQLDLVQIPPATGQRSFATELVFDPRNNQFQTALQQRIPATNEDLNFREQLIAFAPTTTTPRPIGEFRAPVRAPVVEQQPQFQQPREQPRPPFEQPREQPRPQFEQPREEARPQFFPDFQQFQRPSVEDQERNRQDQERRRQQQEEQRLADERQRIAEENERRRITPAVQFVSQPQQQNVRFVADAQFQQQQQQQQPQFFGPPQQQQVRTIAEAERPSFASGQIDSFLSGLGR